MVLLSVRYAQYTGCGLFYSQVYYEGNLHTQADKWVNDSSEREKLKT